MKRIIGGFLLLLGMWEGLVEAQPPDTLWTRLYGGSGVEEARDIEALSDSGFIVAGATNSFGVGYYDMYLLRINRFGDTLWTRTYGIPGQTEERALAVDVCSDGGYILAGFTQGEGIDTDIYLVKTDSFGNMEWQRTMGGHGGDWARSVKQVADGGYILLGFTNSYGAGQGDMYLIRTNAFGDTIWTNTYGGVDIEEGFDIAITTDGGYALCGYTGSFGCGAYFVRTNELGDTLCTRTYLFGQCAAVYSIQTLRDGGFILAGGGDLSPALSDNAALLIRTNANGDTLWTRIYQVHAQNSGGWANSLDTTSDGGVILAGIIGPYIPDYDMWIIRCDSHGDTLWTATYDGLHNMDEAYSIQSVDDGYIVAGYAASSVYIVRIGSEYNDSPFETHLVPQEMRLEVFPNPFNNITTINFMITHQSNVSLQLYDLTGRLVQNIFTGNLSPGQHVKNLNSSAIASGIYFVRLRYADKVQTTKVVHLK